MVRNSATPDHHHLPAAVNVDNANSNTASSAFHSVRDRFRVKRNPNSPPLPLSTATSKSSSSAPSSSDRPWRGGGVAGVGGRSHHHGGGRSVARKLLMLPFRGGGRSVFYLCLFMAVFAFALASMVLQSSLASMVFRQMIGSGSDRGREIREDLKFGSSLKFVPEKMMSQRKFELGEGGLDWLRSQSRIGIRSPRLGLILGSLKKDPLSLMLYTVMKNLRGLGYLIQIYAIENGEAISSWEKIGGQVSILSPEKYGHTDWSQFEGVIVDSFEAKDAISSLMQEPFCSVPLLWIIQEDTLANRLPMYEEMVWGDVIAYWKSAFRRADVIVFPDFSLPMLYSVLDSGNFFVIPGSPVDVWAAERYRKAHSRSPLREEKGFSDDDILVLVVGSSFFYNDLSWDYAVAMHNIGPLLIKYAREEDIGVSFKFVFACGNSSDGYNDALQEIATHLGLRRGSLRHYGLNGDVDGLLLMADIVLYGSSQDEQGFPSLLTRAMSYGIPVIAPDYPVVKKYVVDGVHGIIFSKHKPDALMKAFVPLISNGRLSKFAHSVASSGRLLARNMLASECIAGYAKLLENVLTFPSDSQLPGSISQLKQGEWEWGLFRTEIEQQSGDMSSLDMKGTMRNPSVVYDVEEYLTPLIHSRDLSQNESEILADDIPTEQDWDTLLEIESLEEVEQVEVEEIEERMDKSYGVWDELYRNSRRAEKMKFEANERDEGELERTGQPVCIYEIYDGTGAWPFLHHGSLYRGLSLSTKSRRLRSDDVDAVGRLPVLNDTYYRDILCEIGGMFSIANRLDNIHKRPWIGFQSWRATGRKVSLSTAAEQVLEETMHGKTKGDVIYFWARLDMDGGFKGNNNTLTFWSMCDILNGGHCRSAFENAFSQMYVLPAHVEALPPMPEDGGHWSALHSWVMPTPSFLEFIMFSRIFTDALNNLHTNSSHATGCLLGSSMAERKHCYCRILELLVNVWAYHSARMMIYIDPGSGSLKEQHPIEQRKGFMWAQYFNMTLLKSMDEDLAEAADDDEHQDEKWLWPLTGEIYWQGVYEREREERYRLKMDKKRKTREKLIERLRNGYKQKTLGR